VDLDCNNLATCLLTFIATVPTCYNVVRSLQHIWSFLYIVDTDLGLNCFVVGAMESVGVRNLEQT
jgi:hypothetical protein